MGTCNRSALAVRHGGAERRETRRGGAGESGISRAPHLRGPVQIRVGKVMTLFVKVLCTVATQPISRRGKVDYKCCLEKVGNEYKKQTDEGCE